MSDGHEGPEGSAEKGTTPAPTEGGPTGAAPFVWGVWAVMLLLVLVYVCEFRSRFPYGDAWVMVPVLTGARPLTPAWLWQQHNEHRLPLPKLALYALGKLSGLDFRTGLFLNVALLAGLSFALLLTVRRVRGRLHFTDAFIPLVVLSMGQSECFLDEFSLNLVSSGVLSGTFLLLFACGPQVSARRAVGMALCLVPMPLVGGSGLALVPALALWLALVGGLHCRAADAASRNQGRLVLGLVAAALVLAGLSLVGFQHPNGAPPSPKFADMLRCGLQVLSMVFGSAGQDFYWWKTKLVPALMLCGAVVWVVAWRRRPQERVVLLGYLAFVASIVCLVGAVAWGRADLCWEAGAAPRYLPLVAPLGCCLYLLWERSGTVVARVGQTVLFLLAVAAFLPNLKAAFDEGRDEKEQSQDFAADVASHMPPGLLAERDAGRVCPLGMDGLLAEYLRMLRDARVAGFRSLAEDPPLRTAVLPLSAASLHDMVWADGAARPVGDDPSLAFTLPRADFVYAVRLHYIYSNGVGRRDRFDVSCGTRMNDVILRPGPGDGGGERTATVWINDRIEGFRLTPKVKLFALRLSSVELVLPEQGAPDERAAGRLGAELPMPRRQESPRDKEHG